MPTIVPSRTAAQVITEAVTWLSETNTKLARNVAVQGTQTIPFVSTSTSPTPAVKYFESTNGLNPFSQFIPAQVVSKGIKFDITIYHNYFIQTNPPTQFFLFSPLQTKEDTLFVGVDGAGNARFSFTNPALETGILLLDFGGILVSQFTETKEFETPVVTTITLNLVTGPPSH